jgi:hypothetical protein
MHIPFVGNDLEALRGVGALGGSSKVFGGSWDLNGMDTTVGAYIVRYGGD